MNKSLWGRNGVMFDITFYIIYKICYLKKSKSSGGEINIKDCCRDFSPQNDNNLGFTAFETSSVLKLKPFKKLLPQFSFPLNHQPPP